MMRKVVLIITTLCPLIALSQNVKFLDLQIPKNNLSPENIQFKGDAIFFDKKLCYKYTMEHNISIDNEVAPNYFEIKTLDNLLLFSGIIKKNESGSFENIIKFHLLEKKYKNSEIIGRNSLILNLSSNQVLNKNCSLNIENLQLFYEKSNENK